MPSGVGAVVAGAIVVALAVATRSWFVAVAAGALATAGWSLGAGAVLAMLAAAGVVRADAAWSDLRAHHLGPFTGWATVVAEPERANGADRVLLDVDGQRYEAWVRGRVHRRRVDGWRAGDRVVVTGVRRALAADRQRRVAWQHVVGRLDVAWFGDVGAGSPAANASNRVRALIAKGAAALPADRAALTRGLVIGDDRDEPAAMVERFRAAGLSHLTAVSGQNVTN
jgi:competence protein ComEC